MDNCGYMTLDAFTGQDLGKVSGAQRVSYMVNPSGEKFSLKLQGVKHEEIAISHEMILSGVRLIRFEVDNCHL